MLNSHGLQATYNDIFNNQFLDSISDFDIAENILITGAQGMLGNALAHAIKELYVSKNLNNAKLILCSRNWQPSDIKIWQNFGNIETVTNNNLLNNYRSVDTVIHTASPSNITKINTIDDLRISNIGLLESIFKLTPKKILYLSSGEVYGGDLTDEKQHSKKFSYNVSRDWYPLVKLETEDRLKEIISIYDTQTIIVRLFHTYGPGLKVNDGRSFADILWGAVNKKEIILKSDGKQTRSFLYISDAVRGILKILFTNEHKQITLNLGSIIPLTIREFAELVRSCTGADIYTTIDNKFSHSPNDYIVPTLKAIKNYNWYPNIDINTGISQTIKWMQNIKNNS